MIFSILAGVSLSFAFRNYNLIHFEIMLILSFLALLIVSVLLITPTSKLTLRLQLNKSVPYARFLFIMVGLLLTFTLNFHLSPPGCNPIEAPIFLKRIMPLKHGLRHHDLLFRVPNSVWNRLPIFGYEVMNVSEDVYSTVIVNQSTAKTCAHPGFLRMPFHEGWRL